MCLIDCCSLIENLGFVGEMKKKEKDEIWDLKIHFEWILNN